MGAEELLTTVFAETQRGGTAPIVKDEGLVAVAKVFGDGTEERIGEIAIFFEFSAVFEVDEMDFGFGGGGFGLGVEVN